MFAAFPIWVTVGAGIATVILAVFFNRFAEGNNAQARLTGTFHRSYGGHGYLHKSVFFTITYEQLFRYLRLKSLQTLVGAAFA